MSTEKQQQQKQPHPLYQVNLGEAVDQRRKHSIDTWLITQINAFITEKNFDKTIETPFKLTDDEVNYVSGRLEGKPSETWDIKIAVTTLRSGLQRGFQQFEIQCIKKTPQERKKNEEEKEKNTEKADAPVRDAPDKEEEALFLEFIEEFLRDEGIAFLTPVIRWREFRAFARKDLLSKEYQVAFEMFKIRKAAEMMNFKASHAVEKYSIEDFKQKQVEDGVKKLIGLGVYTNATLPNAQKVGTITGVTRGTASGEVFVEITPSQVQQSQEDAGALLRKHNHAAIEKIIAQIDAKSAVDMDEMEAEPDADAEAERASEGETNDEWQDEGEDEGEDGKMADVD